MTRITYLRTTSDADVHDLLENPHRIEGLLYGLTQAMAAPYAWIGCLLGKPLAANAWRPHIWGSAFDIDRAWHGIHFLLTGDPTSGEGHRAFLLTGGRPIVDVDVGFGPARALLSPEVQTISRTLDTRSPGELQAGCQADRFWAHAIYPDIWDEPFARSFGYSLLHFKGLRDYLRSAAEHDRAIRVDRQ